MVGGKTVAYLTAIHFEFADDLDGHFIILSGAISCTVYIAESPVTHLVH